MTMLTVDAEPAEPTPWATGLTVSTIITSLVVAIDLILSRALAESFGWLWVPANVLIGVGLAPSLWLLHQRRFWRWIAYGVAFGLVLAWIGLALRTLLRPVFG